MSNVQIDMSKTDRPIVPLGQITITPTNGQALVANDKVKNFFLTPAGTLATLSFKLPPKPIDGQPATIYTTQDITALTVTANTGQSIANPPAGAFALGATRRSITYQAVFNGTANATWYCMDSVPPL